MKITKLLSIILCITICLNLISPTAQASKNEISNQGSIVVGSDFASYYFEGTSYRYCLFIFTEPGNAFFSYFSSDNPDYVHEYNFTTPPASINIHSIDYWNDLISLCLDNRTSWTSIYLPTAIIESKNENPSIYARNSNPAEAKLLTSIEEKIGCAPYERSIVATRQWNGILFHLHEDLTYTANESTTFFIAETMTIASLISSVLQVVQTVSLVNIINALFAVGGMIPSGTELQTYNVVARWDRYVKRRDSSVWLTEATQHFISYDAYVNPLTNYAEIDTGTREETYVPSKAYFENTAAQLEEGYNYYLTL